MRRIVLAAFGGAVLAVAGCGHPFIPASALGSNHHASATDTPAAEPADESRPVLGVDLYASHDYSLAAVANDGTADMRYLHDTLHAQSVGLVWNLAAPSDQSDVATTSPESLSADAIAALTRLAEHAGMTVEYRPLIRVGSVADWSHPRLSWEGFIQPARPRAWFASLYQAELPYLLVAKRLHVAEFVVGTELLHVGDSPWWRWFLHKVSEVYSGTISYAAEMHQYVTGYQRLPPVNTMGLDAYPGVRLPDSASQAKVTAAWERSLARVPAELLARTGLDEVSIPSTSGAYHDPADWNAPGTPDPQVQYRWFIAACTTVGHFRMRSVYFYELPLTRRPWRILRFPASFAGKSGAKAIRLCSSILATQ